jgi:hypothetical protein
MSRIPDFHEKIRKKILRRLVGYHAETWYLEFKGRVPFKFSKERSAANHYSTAISVDWCYFWSILATPLEEF